VSDLFGNVEGRPTNTQVTQQIIKDEQRRWKNIINVEGRKNYRKPRNLLTKNAEKFTLKYLGII